MKLFCVCDEEWCFCTAEVEVDINPDTYVGPAPEKPCPPCAEGHHILEPGGPRV